MGHNPLEVPRLGRHNPRLAELRRLARGEDPERTVVDGPKLVAELAGRGVDLLSLFATAERLPPLLALPGVARLAAVGSVYELDEETATRLAPTRSSQGVLAVVSRPHREVAAAGIVLYLDRVQDPGNVGAAIRSAAAFDAGGVLCSPGCGDPFSPKAVRASAGHSLLLPVRVGVTLDEPAAAFVAAGGEVAAACGNEGIAAAGWQPRPPLLLVLGSEGSGIDPTLLRLVTTRVTIPMSGAVESLNIAVTAGILLAALRGVVPSPILE